MRRITAALALLLLAGIPAAAQVQNGNISGSVKDQQGGVEGCELFVTGQLAGRPHALRTIATAGAMIARAARAKIKPASARMSPFGRPSPGVLLGAASSTAG